ncbi:MAG TPA: DUF5661 family protein [bacterium]
MKNGDRGLGFGDRRETVFASQTDVLFEEECMILPVYVTIEEVKRVCKVLKLRDWTKMGRPDVTSKEAKTILKTVNTEKMRIDPEEFRKGLEVELEHGVRFPDANVTNNHPVLTGKIVLAHLKESLFYYRLLEVAEIEGDLVKAVAAKKPEKVEGNYRKLIRAKLELAETEAKQVK